MPRLCFRVAIPCQSASLPAVNTILCGMFIGAITGIVFGAAFGNLTIGIGLGPLFGALGGLFYSIVRIRQANKR